MRSFNRSHAPKAAYDSFLLSPRRLSISKVITEKGRIMQLTRLWKVHPNAFHTSVDMRFCGELRGAPAVKMLLIKLVLVPRNHDHARQHF